MVPANFQYDDASCAAQPIRCVPENTRLPEAMHARLATNQSGTHDDTTPSSAGIRRRGERRGNGGSHTPLSHPFVERLIGTIRLEFLDQTLFWNTIDLEQKLQAFRQYYNNHCVHTAFDGEAPSDIADKTTLHCVSLNNFCWKCHCRDLYQVPVAA